MKAIVYRQYGSPDVLRYEETQKPVAGDNEVLIRVCAAALNPLDWHYVRGMPYGIRFMSGLRKPKDTRLGMDVAGHVEAVGRNARLFQPGDAVFGGCRGAFAEYACTAETALARKPEKVTFEQAGSVAVAAFTALQGLRDKGHIQPGQKVLINGAAGGVGTFAVQLGNCLGAEVTGVCSSRNVEMVRSLGAHHAIDYTREDFTRRGQRYDLILDCIGNHSLAANRRVLTRKGICILVGAPSGRWIAPMGRFMGARLLSPLMSRKLVPIMAQQSQDDLNLMAELMRSGKVIPVIDRRYRLSEVPAAIRYLEEGHAGGEDCHPSGHGLQRELVGLQQGLGLHLRGSARGRGVLRRLAGRLGLTLIRRRRCAVGWRVVRTALEFEVVADDVEILLGKIGFEERAFGGVVELDGESVLVAHDDAGVVRVDGLAVEAAVHIRLLRVLRGNQQAGLFGDDDPRGGRMRDRKVNHRGVGGRVEVGQQHGVLMAVESVGGGLAGGVDADLELTARGVGAQGEGDLRGIHCAGELIVHDIESAVEVVFVGEGVGELRHLQIAVRGDLKATGRAGDRAIGRADGFAVVRLNDGEV
jgi:NADPH:quinone reductase-like Zn-dependent oxidoreductase